METFRLETQPDVRLRVQGCAGNVEITQHDAAAIQVSAEADFERYVHRDDSGSITISGYSGDLRLLAPRQAAVELDGIVGDARVAGVAHVQMGGIGGDAQLAGPCAQAQIGNVGGDLRVEAVQQLKIRSVGGDVALDGRCDHAQIGNVGGDLRVEAADYLQVQSVGGDAALGMVGRLAGLARIGGDLRLTWSGDGDDNLQVIVGGDAAIKLPEAANFTLLVTVGGNLRGSGVEWKIRHSSGRHVLVWGEGGPQLQLIVGGDLKLEGGPVPQRGSEADQGEWHRHPGMDAFGEELRGLGRELEEVGRNLARELSVLGRDIAREVRVAGRETMRGMKDEWGPRGRGQRGRVQFNDREFRFDPEQIERIKREARAAAASGIARAQEAVEQALHQRHRAPAPRRPVSPRGPVPATPPTPPTEPPVGNVYTGQTIRMDGPAQSAGVGGQPAQPADRDAERLAILRMVHEGRLGPDEAEMLLRGLEEQS